MAKAKKQITLSDLDRSVKSLAGSIKNLVGTVKSLVDTVDNLARATQHGFEEAEERNKNRFKVVVNRLDNVDGDIKDIKLSLHSVTQMTMANDKEIDRIKVGLK